METSKKTIVIPDEVNTTWLRKNSSSISKCIMQYHCIESEKTMNLSNEKAKGTTMFRYSLIDYTVFIDAIKSKLMIFLPKNVNSLIIDKFYCDDLRKSLTEVEIEEFPTLKYRKRGLLMFPIISERKVYMIDIDELKSSWLINKDVHKHFGANELESRLQYDIPLNYMKSFEISKNIQFVFGEEKETEEETIKREKSYSLF